MLAELLHDPLTPGLARARAKCPTPLSLKAPAAPSCLDTLCATLASTSEKADRTCRATSCKAAQLPLPLAESLASLSSKLSLPGAGDQAKRNTGAGAGDKAKLRSKARWARLRNVAAIHTSSRQNPGADYYFGSWLVTASSIKGKMGCKVCVWAAKQTESALRNQKDELNDTWAAKRRGTTHNNWTAMNVVRSTLKMSQVKQHRDSIAHKQACNAYVEALVLDADGVLPGKDAVQDILPAPPLMEFELVARSAQEGGKRGGISVSSMSHRRVVTLEWCIAEAVRDSNRHFLSLAKHINLALDERDGRLLIKFRAVSADDQLTVREGCLAVFRDAGMFADDIAKAIHSGIRRFCLTRRPHPGTNRVHCRPCLDNVSMERIKQNVTFFSADGAANMQLAGQLLHALSPRSSENVQPLESLSFRIRDHAHAARRILSRTISVDPVLKRITDVLLFDKNSIARLLQNTRDFRKIFVDQTAKETHSQAGTAKATNFGFKKHRFDGVAQPLLRTTLHLDALMSTASIIGQTRQAGSKQSRGAKAFLHMLSDQAVLLLGMLADAADEVLLLVRFFDTNAFEAEQLAQRVAAFRARIQRLFAQGECLRAGTVTHVAIQGLHRVRVIPGRRPMATLGSESGPSKSLVQECLGRMMAWARLANAVCETEFPGYGLIWALSVFALSNNGQDQTPQKSEHVETSYEINNRLGTLARAFNVDEAALVTQLNEHKRLAQQEFDNHPGESAMEAWRRGFRLTQSDAKRRKRFPADALMPVLRCCLVAPGNTSGIERDFSKAERLLGPQWNGGEMCEERRVTLVIAKITPETLANARRVWAQCYGKPRAAGSSDRRRRNLGHSLKALCRRKARLSMTSESAWLKRRRACLEGDSGPASKMPKAEVRNVATAAEAAWTSTHEEEMLWQKDQQITRLCENVLEGTVPESATPAGVSLQDLRQQRAKRDKEIARDKARREKLLQQPKPLDLTHMGLRYVYVDKEAQAALQCEASRWASRRRELRLREVADRALADIFVVLNPTSPGDRNQLVASMRGGLVCTPNFFLQPPGVVMKCKRMLQRKRNIFCSEQCHKKTRKHVGAVQACVRVAGWGWGSLAAAMLLDMAL